MKPITRIEHYLAAIAGLQDYTPEEPITRLEKYLAYINGKTDSYPEPVTRIDQLIVMQIEKTALPLDCAMSQSQGKKVSGCRRLKQ